MSYSIITRFVCLIAAVLMVATFALGQKTKKRPAEDIPVLQDPIPLSKPEPTPTPNGSLFSSESTTNLVVDFKARCVGDLVFVNVVEVAEANVSSGAARSRESGTVGGVTEAIGAIPLAGAAATSGVVGALGRRKYEGDGQTQRQSGLRARIAARVVQVLPNGDLRIVAEKMVKINKEDEKLMLSGIVRTRDLSGENSVPSTLVGELRVALNGKGIASADNQPGWLFRFLDKISPF
jgi:flagellar L-ring protein precursor FlgH